MGDYSFDYFLPAMLMLIFGALLVALILNQMSSCFKPSDDYLPPDDSDPTDNLFPNGD